MDQPQRPRARRLCSRLRAVGDRGSRIEHSGLHPACSLGDHREDRRLLAAAAVERHRHLAGDPARIRAQRACRHPARRRGGLFRNFERVAFPFMVSLQTIPKVALAPILVMWLGYGILPKVMVAFLISFFPIVINSVIGMRPRRR